MKFFLCLLIFFASVGSTVAHHTKKPNILGSDLVWVDYMETIRDVKVSNLRIKQVRLKSKSCSKGYKDVLELDGRFNDDAVFILDKLLAEISKICRFAPMVTLNSGGGYIVSGIEVGELFRKYDVSAQIVKGQKCQSSCSTAFFGALYRSMDDGAVLMMHSPYIYSTPYSISCASKEDASKLEKYYYKMLGYDTAKILFDRTMEYCSTSNGWTLNKDAAEIFGVLTK